MHTESASQVFWALQTAADRLDNAGDSEGADEMEQAIGHLQALDGYASIITRLEDLAEWNEGHVWRVEIESLKEGYRFAVTYQYTGDDISDPVADFEAFGETADVLLPHFKALGLWSQDKGKA